MPTIGPVTDAYIDSIINANDPYNPNLNKTQGVQLRALIKLLRDRLEQEVGDKLGGYISQTYEELSALVSSGNLVPGQQYILTDYSTVYMQPVSNLIRTDAQIERLVLTAASLNTFFGEIESLDFPDDQLAYDFNNNLIVTSPAVAGWYNISVETDEVINTDDVLNKNFDVVITYGNNLPLYVNEQGHTVADPDTRQYDLSITSVQIRVMIAGGGEYAANGGQDFKMLINGVEYDIAAADVGNYQEDEYSLLPLIANVSGNVKIQVFKTIPPAFTPLPDNSAGTPATSMNRNGFITYREDMKGNLAYFDWRNVKFRRFAADISGIPVWTTGGSYAKYSFVQNGGVIYGLTVDVNNDPNESLDVSPNSPYVNIYTQGSVVLPNLNNPIGPFSQLPADISNYQDLQAIDGAGVNVKMHQGSGVYIDNLPNIVYANGVSEAEVKSGAIDIHVDGCTYIYIGGGAGMSIFINSNYVEAGAALSHVFIFNSSGIFLDNQVYANAVVQSNAVKVGAGSNGNVFYNSNEIAIDTASSGDYIGYSSYVYLAGGSNGSYIQNSQNTSIGFSSEGNSIENSQGVLLGSGCGGNSLTNCSNVDFGDQCNGNSFSQAQGLVMKNQCYSNTQSNIQNVSGIVFEGNNSSNTLAGSNQGVVFGLNANNNTTTGANIVIGSAGNSNNINGNNIKLAVNCSSNSVDGGSTGITFNGDNSSNTIGTNANGIEFGVAASSYSVGNNVSDCYFRKTSGDTIANDSTGIVPWQVPGAGFEPGVWTDINSKSADIENETSPIQYKIDGAGQAMIVYIGAQFTIKSEFTGNVITLGSVGIAAYPVSQTKKYITVLDPSSGSPFGALLTVETGGNINISVVPGFSGNLPNGPNCVYFIDLFYKPTVPVYYYTKTAGFTTQGCTDPLVGTQIPYSKTYQSYISVDDAQNNVAVADASVFNSEGQANANSVGSCIASPIIQDVIFHVENDLVNYYHESTVSAFNNNVYTHLAVIVLMDGTGNIQASVPVPPGTSEWLQKNVNTGWNIAIAIQQTVEIVSPKSVTINTVSMILGVTDLGGITGMLNDNYRWLMSPRNVGVATEIDINVSDDTDEGVPLLLSNEMGSTPFIVSYFPLFSGFVHNIGTDGATYPSGPNNWFSEFRWIPDNWAALSINVGGDSLDVIADLYARRTGGDVLLYQYSNFKVYELMETNDIFVMKKSTGDPTNHRIVVTDDRTNNSDPIIVGFFNAAQQAYVVMQPGDTAYGKDYVDSDIVIFVLTEAIRLNTADRLNIFAVLDGALYTNPDDGSLQWTFHTYSNGGIRAISVQDIVPGDTPPVMLVVNSAQADPTRATITLNFNKEMTDPSGKEADFNVLEYLPATGAGPVAVSSLSLDPNNSTHIIVTLATPLDSTAYDAYISYSYASSGAGVSSTDGVYLARFNEMTVTLG